MFIVNKLLSVFKKPEKSIAFLDCDQPIPPVLLAKDKYLQNYSQVFSIRHSTAATAPKSLRDRPDINQIYLEGFRRKAETTDKFIAMLIQNAVRDGYSTITVVSADYDFIDIFKMCITINDLPNASLKFKLIVPYIHNRLEESKWLESKSNIEIIKA